MKEFKVTVKFAHDEENHVWYVLNSTVPGLHVEADSVEEMVEAIEECVPELLIAKGLLPEQQPQPSVSL